MICIYVHVYSLSFEQQGRAYPAILYLCRRGRHNRLNKCEAPHTYGNNHWILLNLSSLRHISFQPTMRMYTLLCQYTISRISMASPTSVCRDCTASLGRGSIANQLEALVINHAEVGIFYTADLWQSLDITVHQPDQVNTFDPWAGGHEVPFVATSDCLPSHPIMSHL